MTNVVEPLRPGEAGWQTLSVHLGREIDVALELFRCQGIRLGATALVVAGIHGDEYEGPSAVARLAEELDPERVSGAVWLLPVANPLAFAAGTRTSPVDGANLARLFPGKAGGTPTERLAYFLFTELGQRAECLIDLHSGGVEYEFLPVCGFYGKPHLENHSYRSARAMGLPVLWQLPETPGVFSREFGQGGKTAIGAEYLGGGRLSKEGIFAYVQGVKSCLGFWGIWSGQLKPGTAEPKVYGNDWILASATGMFHTHCELGDQVRQGDELATIQNLRGEVLTRILALEAGTILGLRSKAHIRQSDWAVLVGTELET
jgi:predicted deacylase